MIGPINPDYFTVRDVVGVKTLSGFAFGKAAANWLGEAGSLPNKA